LFCRYDYSLFIFRYYYSTSFHFYCRAFISGFSFLHLGHEHAGGYFYDKEHRIHFNTLPSPLESQSEDPRGPYAILHVFSDHLEVEGFGAIQSARYEIAPY
jgi:hypothetical protein